MKKSTPARILISSAQTAADIRYLCGVEPPEAAVFTQIGREKKLIVSEMEFNRMRRSAKRGITVLHPNMLGSSWKKGAADWIKKAVSEKRLHVTADFPLGLAEKLRRSGYRLTISKEPPCPQRVAKTEAEIKAIRVAQRAAVEGAKTAQQLIAAARIATDKMLFHKGGPLISKAVRAAIHKRLMDFDCVAEETIVACGPCSADPHERGEGPLRAGEPIVIDIFPRHAGGYWGDLSRTVCRGPAPPELKKMYKAVKAAQAAALKDVKVGAWTDDVHAAAAAELDRRGFSTDTISGVPQGFIHGTGHGVGLEIHEAPRVSAANHQKLRAGNVITIEPGLYYPKIGGVRIEDTILVTKDGYKMLAPCPKRLEL